MFYVYLIVLDSITGIIQKTDILCFTKTCLVYNPLHVFVLSYVPCRAVVGEGVPIQRMYFKFYMRAEYA